MSAHALSALFASSYVASIYLSNLFSSSARSSKSFGGTQAVSEPSKTAPIIAATDEAINAAELHGPRPGDRDHPATIKRRMAAVSIATVGSMITLFSVVKQLSGGSLRQSVSETESGQAAYAIAASDLAAHGDPDCFQPAENDFPGSSAAYIGAHPSIRTFGSHVSRRQSSLTRRDRQYLEQA